MRETGNYAPPLSTAAATSQMRNVPYVFMYDCRRVACKQVFGGLVSEATNSPSGAIAEQPASAPRTELFISLANHKPR
jgi:hypothetical protein